MLIGGCRNEGDFKRVEELKRIVADLGMEDREKKYNYIGFL